MFGMIYNFLRKVYGDLEDDLLKKQAIVVIDEIDGHLHPAWQQKILQLLRETFENVQFIVTAHSPLVIAGCLRKEVAVLGRKQDKRFAVEVIPGHFIGATSADIYAKIFDIEEKDQTYKTYDTLLPEKESIRARVEALKAMASRSPEAEKELRKRQDDLKNLEDLEEVKQKREAQEAVEDVKMAYVAKSNELEDVNVRLKNLQEQERIADQADNELATAIGRCLNEGYDGAMLVASISDLLRRKNKPELAIPILEKAAEISPNNVSVLSILAQNYLMTKRYKDAVSVSQKALAIAPNDIVSLRNLAAGLQGDRRFEEAEIAYRKVLELQPDDLQSTLGLGKLLYALKRFEEAVAVCRQGLHHHPQNEALTELLEDLDDEQSAEPAEG